MHPEILAALKTAGSKRFWGMVQVDFQDGKPTLVRVSETKKIDKEKNQSNESRPISHR